MSSRAQKKLSRFAELQLKKSMFEHTFELIARYIEMRDITFSNKGEHSKANLIPEELFDNTAAHVGSQSKSSVLGSVWPSGATSFQLERHRSLPDSKEMQAWFSEVNGVMTDIMDDPRNGLQVALEEAVSELFDYGTLCLTTVPNNDLQKPIKYKSWSVIGKFIDENADGFIDTVYYCESLEVRKVVEKYGLDNVSSRVRDMFDNDKKNEKILVLTTIEPRENFDPTKGGIAGMPIEVLHLEIDTGKILHESGFEEMPAAVARMKKFANEVWGRSPGINALPDIIELNAVWEAITIAVEKSLDPPLALLDDGRLGAGDINTSAGALNVFSTSGRITGGDLIFPIFTIGNFEPIIALVDKLSNSIAQFYSIDRLLDLNNQNEMTLGEANIRNNLRGTSLTSLFVRLIAELFVPVIDRTFNILFQKGYFGVIPGSTLEEDLIFMGRPVTPLPVAVINNIILGQKVYNIKFISPAARIIQAEEAEGIVQLFTIAAEAAQVKPGVLDNVNVDNMVKRLASILGISNETIESAESVAEVRIAQAEQVQQQSQLADAREISEIERNNAQTAATRSNINLV